MEMLHDQRSPMAKHSLDGGDPEGEFSGKTLAPAPFQLFASDATPPSIDPPPKNDTGLPDGLKTGMENLSGISLDDVKVHRNSDKPAQLQAHAYAQGSDIHLGPGQEKHLPHEAWHVVQQKQGRVKATRQMKGQVNVNDDAGLEKEADDMGEKALRSTASGPGKLQNADDDDAAVVQGKLQATQVPPSPGQESSVHAGAEVVQKVSVDPAGTVKSPNTAKVWLAPDVTHDTGDLYTKNIGPKASKEELLKAIAKAAGDIGATQSIQIKSQWAQSAAEYGGEKKDAFRVRFSGSYGAGNTPLAMDYHFGPRSHGYVVNVSENGNTSAMVDNNPANNGNGVAAEYSSIHRHTNNENLLANTNHAHGAGTSKNASEKAWDSHTKIAGEGARFIAVRNHAGNLTDNSKFFTRSLNTFKWILFKELWLTWSATFDTAFNISSSRVALKLDGNAMQKLNHENNPVAADTGTGDQTNITANTDYNLTDDRPANLADTQRHKEMVFTYQTAGKGKLARLQSDRVKNTLEGSDLVVRSWMHTETQELRTYKVLVPDNVTPQQLTGLLAPFHKKQDTISVAGMPKPESADHALDEVEPSLEKEPEEADMGGPVRKTKTLAELDGYYSGATRKLLRQSDVSQAEILERIKQGNTGFTFDAKTNTVSYLSTDRFNEMIASIVGEVAKTKKKVAPQDKRVKATRKATEENRASLSGGQQSGAGIALAMVVIIILLVIGYLFLA